MNPYESSSRINAVVIPEMVLHGMCSFLLLVMGYWFMFLLTLPIAIYNSMLYINRRHLIDVTEVFRYVDAEKRYRIAKLAVYLFLFVLVVIRLVVSFHCIDVFYFKTEVLVDFCGQTVYFLRFK
ncbi:hypothetical protein HanPI659440_Chr10g0370601 [Helianthus annuus]|nr:hypothetical protein HanHA89_Chr10g0378021 [Helianthus annuus]KAJ0630612.1 hypothetical protein HanHA300_Chr00c0176g0724761 [Helianthus annuus]KAJ0743001.1 hypothetical protein HanPI659440_Chr10g0370601 [Helianthus annuus]